MAEKELTAIEWIMYKLPSDWTSPYVDFIFEEGKAMEEKQIKDAWNNGVLAKTFEKTFEQYYNEKYEK